MRHCMYTSQGYVFVKLGFCYHHFLIRLLFNVFASSPESHGSYLRSVPPTIVSRSWHTGKNSTVMEKNRTIALSHGSHLGLVSWVSVGQMLLKPRIGIGGFQTFTLRPARFFKVFTNAVLFPVNMCILYICILI